MIWAMLTHRCATYRLLVAVLLSVIAFGCEEKTEPVLPAAAAVADDEQRRSAESEEPEPPPEPTELPMPTSSEVERMGRGDLEAACMRGSQAACDQLGH